MLLQSITSQFYFYIIILFLFTCVISSYSYIISSNVVSIYIYMYSGWTIVVSARRQPKRQFVQPNHLIHEFRGEWTSLLHADVFIDVHIYIYKHIQCLLLTVVDWCMIYWWVYQHLIFTLNPSSNACKTYITISLSQPVVVCRKWSCMLPMPKNWVQHKNAWPSLIGFGGCHLSSASHVEE